MSLQLLLRAFGMMDGTSIPASSIAASSTAASSIPASSILASYIIWGNPNFLGEKTFKWTENFGNSVAADGRPCIIAELSRNFLGISRKVRAKGGDKRFESLLFEFIAAK